MESVAQIDKSITLYSGTHGEKHTLEVHFKRIVKNIKKFNGSLCTYKMCKPANGRQFKVYYKGNLIKEISFLSDRYGWEILNTTYKQGN